MITVRRSEDRFHTDLGWLDSRHTFSFGDHYDPSQLGFRALRVINEDRVMAGGGFPTHPHRDMEILSYVLDGALAHKDSMGNGSRIEPGEVQRMSAGTGVRHSELNAANQTTHFLQIWIVPEQRGLPPGYEQRAFPASERQGKLRLLAARDGRDGAVTIHQDAELYGTLLEPGARVTHTLRPGRHAWVQVARGAVRVAGEDLQAGDGAALSEIGEVEITASTPSEVLLFDLA
jgi:quercetin 2,3-dioxygenase